MDMSVVDPAFFSDFAVDVTIGGTAARGIFDNAHGLAFGGLIDGSGPMLRISSHVDVAQGDAVVIGPASFTVATIEPDGTGLTLLRLESV